MPVYEFRCPECDLLFTESIPISEVSDIELTCPDDNTLLKRIFTSPGVIRDMPGHFNTSAGKYVPNLRTLKDEFKRMGEDYSKRTGMDSDFQVIDSQEVPGLTHEGLESTFRARNIRNTAALERRIDRSDPPRAVRKPKQLTGGWTDPT